MMSDSIADMLTRIRNAIGAEQPDVSMPHTKTKENIAKILKQEGYITGFSSAGEVTKKQLTIELKYQGRKSVIEGLKRISRPGLRRYIGSGEVPRVRNGLGTAIVSTSRGVITGRDARRQNVGGELLAYIW
ncbi:MAG: 30S ribosomal protein S8 [Limisphaerales bacterium]